MEKAIKQIEKLKKGITDNPAVMDILRKANESKENEVKQESRKYFDTKPGSIQDTVIKMYEDRLNEAQKWDLKDIQNTIKNSPKVKPYPKHTYHRRKLHAWDLYDLKRMKNHHNNPHSILKWDLKKISPNTDKGVDQLQQIEKAIYGLSQGLKTGKLSKQTMTDLSKEGVPLLSDIAKSLV